MVALGARARAFQKYAIGSKQSNVFISMLAKPTSQSGSIPAGRAPETMVSGVCRSLARLAAFRTPSPSRVGRAGGGLAARRRCTWARAPQLSRADRRALNTCSRSAARPLGRPTGWAECRRPSESEQKTQSKMNGATFGRPRLACKQVASSSSSSSSSLSSPHSSPADCKRPEPTSGRPGARFVQLNSALTLSFHANSARPAGRQATQLIIHQRQPLGLSRVVIIWRREEVQTSGERPASWTAELSL